jgi:V8-like Glu-specific endopeptidase
MSIPGGLRATSLALLVAALLVAGALPAIGGPPAEVPDRPLAEMPARVMTEGFTVEQHLALQAHMSAQLLAELPPAPYLREARVKLDPAEIAAIDQAEPSSTPLKIGLVKPLVPITEVFGLDDEVSGRQPRRGASEYAMPSPAGGRVWALSVRAPGAGAIRLHLEDVSLPEGAELYVYTRDGEAYGPYTGAGPDDSGEFWVTTVFGPEAILQLRLAPTVTPDELGEVSFRVTEVGVITEHFADAAAPEAGGFCGNPSCIVDASCYSGANSIKDAYAKMEWVAGAYIYTCTGGLLNDSNPTQSNFFLTANHCLSKSSTAKNVAFYWRFRTSTCNGSCPSNTGWPYKTTGSSVAVSGRKGDFTLLQLNSAPPAGSVFLGWTSTPVANTNGVLLHRVSNPNFGPQVYNQQTVSTSAPVCRSWPRGERIYSRDTLGGTDGGSSGSPVVNGSDQVVGQLSGACGTNVNDPCDAASNATVDGALAYYWASVKPFLAP